MGRARASRKASAGFGVERPPGKAMERALANHLGDGDANEIAACGGAAAPPDLYSREFSFTAASHVDRERNKNPAGILLPRKPSTSAGGDRERASRARTRPVCADARAQHASRRGSQNLKGGWRRRRCHCQSQRRHQRMHVRAWTAELEALFICNLGGIHTVLTS